VGFVPEHDIRADRYGVSDPPAHVLSELGMIETRGRQRVAVRESLAGLGTSANELRECLAAEHAADAPRVDVRRQPSLSAGLDDVGHGVVIVEPIALAERVQDRRESFVDEPIEVALGVARVPHAEVAGARLDVAVRAAVPVPFLPSHPRYPVADSWSAANVSA